MKGAAGFSKQLDKNIPHEQNQASIKWVAVGEEGTDLAVMESLFHNRRLVAY